MTGSYNPDRFPSNIHAICIRSGKASGISPIIISPMITCVIRPADVIKVKCDFISMIVDIAGESVVVQTIIANLNGGSFLDKFHMDITEIYSPVNMVGHIIPRGVAIVIYQYPDPLENAYGSFKKVTSV